MGEEAKGCLFLDRDGVIIEDRGYVYRPEETVFFPEIFEIIQLARKKQLLVVAVTNQAGIARGIFSEEQYIAYQAYLDNQLTMNGASIDAWYYCPYHPQALVDVYRCDSQDRKPHPGMFLKAVNDLKIDIKKSIMIGDKDSDFIPSLNLKTFLIKGNYPINANVPHFNNHAELLRHLKSHL